MNLLALNAHRDIIETCTNCRTIRENTPPPLAAIIIDITEATVIPVIRYTNCILNLNCLTSNDFATIPKEFITKTKLINRTTRLNPGYLKYSSIISAQKKSIKYKKTLTPRLYTNTVEQSIGFISFSFIKEPPKPASLIVVATIIKTDNTPICPKSSGVRDLARIIMVNSCTISGPTRHKKVQTYDVGFFTF